METKQKPFSRTKLYLLRMELDHLKEEMGVAMQVANSAYVATGRPTPRMEETLARFYDWARRYEGVRK